VKGETIEELEARNFTMREYIKLKVESPQTLLEKSMSGTLVDVGDDEEN
jgi:hypothetical protein